MKKPAKHTQKVLFLLCLIILVGILLFWHQITKVFTETVDQQEKTVVSDGQSYRAKYHFTTPDKWKNDPQKPIYLDGFYHYYYLYNGDYPDGNGTEWRHAVSKDLVHWKDKGIAIPKYTNQNGDPWSGSVVVDKENTAGFGYGAFIAIVTQPSANQQKQEQFLWYSLDNGSTFTSYSDTPVMTNPGTDDFRDPKIIWSKEYHKWIMLMAEGTKIGFYESSNLKDWTYLSDFFTNDIGIVECPDLYYMQTNDGSFKWVLGASANGKTKNQPTTYAYWIGHFDGNHFTADHPEPQWLDYGLDWYAGVTFEDGSNSDDYKKRYAFAWMNNWNYADNTPTLQEGFNGMDSVVRQIQLKNNGENSYYLASQPIEAYNKLAKTKDHLKEIEVNGQKQLEMTGEIYQLETDILWTELDNVGLRLRESSDQKRYVNVGIFIKEKYSYVNRSLTEHPDQQNTHSESTAPFPAEQTQVHLKILVDKSSIEVFVDDGKVVQSNLIFPHADDQAITLYSDGGTAIFKNMTITHFD